MKNLLQRYFTSAFLCCVFLFGVIACEQRERNKAEYEVMGTYLVVTIDGKSRSADSAASRAAYDEIQRINGLMSTWSDDTPLSRLNREASNGWTEADAEILSVLQSSIHYSRRTAGGFDVTAGPLVRLWGFLTNNEQRPPRAEEIEAAMAKVGWNKIEIDSGNSLVRFTVDGMEIDFGAIAKGYAVDCALARLREAGVDRALVNLGGNIGIIGSPAGRESWSVAVRDPRYKDALLGTLSLGADFDGWGVASSGQYERYFEYEGRRYGHIIDPRSGYPAEGVLGTTIVAPSAMQADALSTSLFIIGEEGIPSLLAEEPGTLGMIMLPDGESGLRILISRQLAGHFSLFEGAEGVSIEEF